MGIGNQQTSRILGLDLARVLAILFMVQGHTLDVLLAPDFRQGGVWDFWLFLRGLTAPMFLILAGFSFTIVTTRRWESATSFSSLPWKRLTRFGIFVLLGYAMHAPARSLADLQFVDAAGWQSWLQVDVLQCVGISLILLTLLALFARTPARFAWIAFGLGWLVILTTPLLWKSTSITGSAFFDAYLNGNSGSIFPLFPWLGYILVGSATGYAFLRWQSAGILKWFAAVGVALIAIGFMLEPYIPRIYGDMDFWRTSPTLFLTKFGGVCVVLSGLLAIAGKLRLPESRMRSIAQESLVVYLVHIVIVYGSAWNGGLRQSVGASLDPWSTFGYIVVLLISMIIMALAWNWSKRTLPEMAKAFAVGMMSRIPAAEPES